MLHWLVWSSCLFSKKKEANLELTVVCGELVGAFSQFEGQKWKASELLL